ncbi:hypothetical protein [Streptomyces sp. NPDC048473]|uniref:hypothetical protein n=1 Tax=unclassified Streptomyces TaxID=2593676 RepID=UPI00371D879B
MSQDIAMGSWANISLGFTYLSPVVGEAGADLLPVVGAVLPGGVVDRDHPACAERAGER